MIDVKILEVRDEMTLIPVIGVRVYHTSVESLRKNHDWLIQRAGWGVDQAGIYLFPMHGHGSAPFDPYGSAYQGEARTIREAHIWLREHWNEIQDGGVLDIEFILGETDKPKVSAADAPF